MRSIVWNFRRAHTPMSCEQVRMYLRQLLSMINAGTEPPDTMMVDVLMMQRLNNNGHGGDEPDDIDLLCLEIIDKYIELIADDVVEPPISVENLLTNSFTNL